MDSKILALLASILSGSCVSQPACTTDLAIKNAKAALVKRIDAQDYVAKHIIINEFVYGILLVKPDKHGVGAIFEIKRRDCSVKIDYITNDYENEMIDSRKK